jgi:hypothetical protein
VVTRIRLKVGATVIAGTNRAFGLAIPVDIDAAVLLLTPVIVGVIIKQDTMMQQTAPTNRIKTKSFRNPTLERFINFLLVEKPSSARIRNPVPWKTAYETESLFVSA